MSVNTQVRSAALPDLNSGYVTYRKYILSALASSNYDLATGYLYDLNAILPDDYKVEISTIKYNKKRKDEVTQAFCKHCKEPCLHKDIKIRNILLSSFGSLVSKRKYEDVWECPKCHKDNLVIETDFEQLTLPKPHYLQVVPNPPEKKNGLVEALEYEKKMKVWIQMFQIELEHSMSKYRLEYVPKDQREAEELENSEFTLEDYE